MWTHPNYKGVVFQSAHERATKNKDRVFTLTSLLPVKGRTVKKSFESWQQATHLGWILVKAKKK